MTQEAPAAAARSSSPTCATAPASTRWSNGSGAACCSKTERVGRDGFLGLRFERRGARTVLAGQRMTPPLQAMAPITLADGSAYAMLLNNGGGMVGGDRLRVEIELGADATARITTASAGKVYRTIGPAASHETAIRLAPGARLDYLPDHLIPHAGAALVQRLTVAMEPGSRAILYAALAAGRIARDERFAFRRVEDLLEVRYAGRPILMSRAVLEPALRRLDGFGVMANFNYVASLVVAGEAAGAAGGASPLAAAGCIVRWMASGAAELRRNLAVFYAAAAQAAFDESPPALRK